MGQGSIVVVGGEGQNDPEYQPVVELEWLATWEVAWELMPEPARAKIEEEGDLVPQHGELVGT